MSELVTIRVRFFREGSERLLPRYQTDGASGVDLCADVGDEISIQPGQRALIPTGIAVEMPPGVEGQVRPRSGLAMNHGVTCLNTPGTVDSDYRGEICVILVNLGGETFVVRRGDRVAQLVFSTVVRAVFQVVGELGATSRGGGGFGHTGR